jgi:nucleotide-binding universal stress UspA family protein
VAFRAPPVISPGRMLMTLRDVLVCLDATAAGDRRLALALDLAHANKAHLTAVYELPEMEPPPPLPAGAGLPPTILGPASPDGASAIGGEPIPVPLEVQPVLAEAEHAEAAERRFHQELARREISGEWLAFERGELTELIRCARAADLVVLGQYPPDAREGAIWLKPDDVMVEIGRPVLVVPYAGAFERVGRRVLVAWNGTREANRALNDALPLIADADEVTVMRISDQESDLDADRPALELAIAHMGRHGIRARAEESLHPGIGVCDALLSRAADLSADLIVAGAYHHSPFRESLFGGVSRDLLDRMTVPVLMSH